MRKLGANDKHNDDNDGDDDVITPHYDQDSLAPVEQVKATVTRTQLPVMGQVKAVIDNIWFSFK